MSGEKPIRAYVDTSVFGGVFDEEFAEHSRAFFLRVDAGEIVVLLGDVTEEELVRAPSRVREFASLLPATTVIRCVPIPKIAELAEAYLAAGVVSRKWRGDALQVATATVHEADVLVSWNFKHIVRFDRVRAFNSVNKSMGYGQLYICSPAEVRYGGESENI